MNWIQTHNNLSFNLDKFNIDNIDIYDIAHSLSYICRFTGHCNRFYSVAEHTLNCMRAVDLEYNYENISLKRLVLVHDFAEAYLGDVSSPLKRILSDGYTKLEKELESIIYRKFNIEVNTELLSQCKNIDYRMLQTERLHLFDKKLSWGSFDIEYQPYPINVKVNYYYNIEQALLNLCEKYL